jgi:hypothetical protein
MLALVSHLPRESALARALHGEQAAWGDTEHLLAHILDILAAGNWQRGGGKGPRPRACPRPGKTESDEAKRYGKGGIPMERARALFRQWREGRIAEYGGGDN